VTLRFEGGKKVTECRHDRASCVHVMESQITGFKNIYKFYKSVFVDFGDCKWTQRISFVKTFEKVGEKVNFGSIPELLHFRRSGNYWIRFFSYFLQDIFDTRNCSVKPCTSTRRWSWAFARYRLCQSDSRCTSWSCRWRGQNELWTDSKPVQRKIHFFHLRI